jgi:starch synthase
VYFIDNDDYFGKRLMEKDEQGEDYPDNGERAIFFARGVLETVKKLRWVPDVIHCQGWMSAVVPLYVKTAYHDEPSFADAKVVTSLFTQKLDKNLGDNFKKCLEFRDATPEILKGYNDNFDFIELGKLAIDYSDGIVQSEQLVNEELLAYSKAKNIPILNYTANVAEACEDFYETLFPAEE